MTKYGIACIALRRYVEKMGGWRPGSDIMKKVYDYTKRKQEKESQEAFARKMDDFMFG